MKNAKIITTFGHGLDAKTQYKHLNNNHNWTWFQFKKLVRQQIKKGATSVQVFINNKEGLFSSKVKQDIKWCHGMYAYDNWTINDGVIIIHRDGKDYRRYDAKFKDEYYRHIPLKRRG